MFKCLFFPNEWHFYTQKEKILKIEFLVVSKHAVKIWDHLKKNCSLLLVSPLDGIQYLYRADEYKFLLVSQHWHVYV